ncbi:MULTISPECIES: hypothetical protein [unclassified Streptomyces]|uniref:hypothetical protein n=1 Tax=unclassified Streptomyces TaxID=2593676 RepID=UPI0033B33E92
MIVLALTGLLVLVLGGCACVWWAARGGPRWARAVAVVILAAGELVRAANRTDRTGGKSGSDD